jgi:hypothetical protein
MSLCIVPSELTVMPENICNRTVESLGIAAQFSFFGYPEKSVLARRDHRRHIRPPPLKYFRPRQIQYWEGQIKSFKNTSALHPLEAQAADSSGASTFGTSFGYTPTGMDLF